MRKWVALTVGAFGLAAGAADKPEVPPADKRAEVLAAVRRVNWADYRRTDPSRCLALADRLAGAAAESVDADSGYVLWTEAAARALRGGEVEPAVRAVREIDRRYRGVDPADLLAGLFAEHLGAPDRRPAYRCLAEAELADEKSPRALADLAAEWKRAGDAIASAQRGTAYRRGRGWAAEALDGRGVKGLDRLVLVHLHRELTDAAEAADAKAGRFTLYAGIWQMKVGSESREYVVTADGKVTADAPPAAPLAKAFGALPSGSRPPALRLTRRDGAVLVVDDARAVVEKWKLTGDELTVKRYDPASRTPQAATASGTGVRVNESRLTGQR